MTRIEALRELQAKINDFSEYLQGGYLKKENAPHPVDIAAEFEEVESLDNMASSCDEVAAWIFEEIEKEEEKENELLPVEEFQGHAAGQ